MKVRIVTVLLLGAALGVLNTGSRAGDKDTAPKKGKLYNTPEAVFKAYVEADRSKDFKTVVDCLTPESLNKMAGLMTVGGRMAKMVAGIEKTDKSTKVSEQIDKIFARHGLTKEVLKDADSVSDSGPMAFAKYLKKVVGKIKDRPGFVVEMSAAMAQLRKPEEGNPELTLKDVKITGATASATALLKMGDKQIKQPITFKKIGGGWKMELPERPQGPADAPKDR